MELQSDKIKIAELLDLRRSHMLTVNPEYQRGAVWGEAQQKRLIDSVLRGYPLPLIYLHYKKIIVSGMSRESLEIIDGQQRINALYAFAEGGLKLFDPVKDDKKARFPEFIKHITCPWAHCDYLNLSDHLKSKFNNTEIFIVKLTTGNEDEARDLFIRLQAGLPLNPQEKRDAWPGGFTEFTLRFGGKREIARYPGHDFFRKIVANKSTDRGEIRTLCAQIGMLFFSKATEGNWLDLSTQVVDDYYYQHLAFDPNSLDVMAFSKVLDLAYQIFENFKGPRLKANEAIHVILLIASMVGEYTKDWYINFIPSFEKFRHNVAIDKRRREGEYWFQYGALTMTQAANALTIQRRHTFFSGNMIEWMKPKKKDEIRGYGLLEREIIYYRDKKLCAVCGYEVNWQDLEIHHVDEYQNGGETTLENGVCVHKQCHPKGKGAIEFFEKWKRRNERDVLSELTYDTTLETLHDNAAFQPSSATKYKIENLKKGVSALGIITETRKFCILKGSTIAAQVSESFNDTAKAASGRRARLIEDGSINSEFSFTKDVIFNSRSNAASLVLGFSANGNVAWIPVKEE